MSEERLLYGIERPSDLRKLPREKVDQVAQEIRQEILERVSQTGGHLASSLGAVELITAIHFTFDTPSDRLILDVGHQGYPHKMLTGRREDFDSIGQRGGISKFLRRQESEYDHFGAGHAGTSISAALGMARAKFHQCEDGVVIALIGDGSMTAGMAFEALNHAGHIGEKNLIVVLNDNEMSIDPNVGALSSYLSRKLSAPMARRMKGWAKEFLSGMPGDMLHWARKAEESLKVFFSPGLLFEALGFRYVGPIQGHRMDVVLETLENVKQMVANGSGPVLIHALTAKGHGYAPAEADPLKYHGVGQFDVESGEFAPKKALSPTYTNVFAEALIRLADEDERIVAITAAMASGTGLGHFARAFPERFYDVGIAEQHAVTFAAGLASEGMKPVAAIYSTFLQRAFDQVVHDVCLQNLDVTFALDRAGLVGADGATHQGLLDFAYFRALPNAVVMAPKDENELQHMLKAAIGHRGTAMIDVLSPCVTFNDHEGSTKSYAYLKSHDDPLEELDFVPYFEDINVDYEPGTTQEVRLHDGSHLYLKKLDDGYDPTDKMRALRVLHETHERGEFATGLVYVEPKAEDFLATLNLVDEPLAALPQNQVRPPESVLNEIMEALG